MTFSDELFDNRGYILTSIAQLINDEKDRIVSSGAATPEDVNEFVALKLKNTNASGLVRLHNQLKTFILPGDLKKVAAEEEAFMDLSGLPSQISKPGGGDFYDLTGVFEEIEKARAEGQEPTEDVQWEDEEDKKEGLEEENPEEVIAQSVIGELEKLAHSLGSQGEHQAAYAIERTIKAIHRDVENRNLMQERK